MRTSRCVVRDVPASRSGIILLLLATSLVGVPTGVPAQTPLPGDPVRVTVDDSMATYVLRAILGDTLVLEAPKATLRIPFADIDRLEVGSLRPPTQSGRTALAVGVGAVIGGFVGGLVAAAVVPSEECDQPFCFPDLEPLAQGAAIGAVVGAGIGFVAMAFSAGGHPGWTWDAVDTTRLQVRAAPRPFGIGLGVTLRP